MRFYRRVSSNLYVTWQARVKKKNLDFVLIVVGFLVDVPSFFLLQLTSNDDLNHHDEKKI